MEMEIRVIDARGYRDDRKSIRLAAAAVCYSLSLSLSLYRSTNFENVEDRIGMPLEISTCSKLARTKEDG